MDRVEVTDHENARTVAAPGGPRLQNVAEAVAAGRALDPRADGRHVPLDQIDQLVDLPAFVGGSLDLHPFADAVEYLHRVDLRKVRALLRHRRLPQNGRASCRARGGQYVLISVVAVSLK